MIYFWGSSVRIGRVRAPSALGDPTNESGLLQENRSHQQRHGHDPEGNRKSYEDEIITAHVMKITRLAANVSDRTVRDDRHGSGVVLTVRGSASKAR